MTGFGAARTRVELEGTLAQLDLELRSVNNKFLKLTCRLPDGLQCLEGELEGALRNLLQRGSVILTLEVQRTGAGPRINAQALHGYVDALASARAAVGDGAAADLATLLTLPGVLDTRGTRLDADALRSVVLDLAAAAAERLREMRAREGEALRVDLQGHLEAMACARAHIASRAPAVVTEYHQRLRARVAELTGEAGLKLDEPQLLREVALMAERCDISEELTRLGAHLEAIAALLASPEPAGRRLDFLAQELLREANTIGSKANDAQIAARVIDLKTAIDRIKEQVQNVV
jgi:uncharacterized protein (TIGR00255 family)